MMIIMMLRTGSSFILPYRDSDRNIIPSWVVMVLLMEVMMGMTIGDGLNSNGMMRICQKSIREQIILIDSFLCCQFLLCFLHVHIFILFISIFVLFTIMTGWSWLQYSVIYFLLFFSRFFIFFRFSYNLMLETIFYDQNMRKY